MTYRKTGGDLKETKDKIIALQQVLRVVQDDAARDAQTAQEEIRRLKAEKKDKFQRFRSLSTWVDDKMKEGYFHFDEDL